MKGPAPEKREREDGKFVTMHVDKVRVQRFKDYILATRSKYTCFSYVAAVRRFEQFLDENGILLKEAQPGTLEDFIVWLSKKGLSAASIKLMYEGTKAYVNWCRDHGEVTCPNFARPKMPKDEKSKPFILQPNELVLYFQEVSKLSEPSRTALLILPYCGLRVSELCQLRLDNISSEYDKKGNKWIIFNVHGKGKKIRECPLALEGNNLLVKYLSGWRSRQSVKTKWLFPSKRGKNNLDHLSAKTLQLNLRNVRERIDLPKELTPHALRRTCFTYLYRKGVDVATIAKIAGHSSVDVTMKHYIQVSTQDILNKMNK